MEVATTNLDKDGNDGDECNVKYDSPLAKVAFLLTPQYVYTKCNFSSNYDEGCHSSCSLLCVLLSSFGVKTSPEMGKGEWQRR